MTKELKNKYYNCKKGGKTKRSVVFIIFALLVTLFVYGVTVRIVPTPFIYPTIQSAIDASSDSDIVLVIPAYTGAGEIFPITINNKNIFIKGVSGPTDTTLIPGLIPVRGTSGQPVFKYINVTYGLLAGFTITGGRVGVHCENSIVAIAQNVIRDNHGPKGAGVLSSTSSAPMISFCTIENNIADSCGGGIYIEPMAGAAVTSDTIRNNTALYGGGIYIGAAGAEISSNEIYGNAASKGGGVFFDLCGASFSGNKIHHNRASIAGGGLYITNGSNPIISADTFANNIAPRGAGIFVNAYEDTLISITPPYFSMLQSVFNGDSATRSGGGIYISRQVFAGISNITFIRTIADSFGGAIYADNPGTLFVSNCTFYRTRAKHGGGGLYGFQPQGVITKNCVFYADSATRGGAILLNFTSPPLSQTIIANNIFDNSIHPTNSVVYSNSANVYFEYNRIPGSGAIVGFPVSTTNATGFPLFAFTTPTDFRLRLDSPCIDTGDPDTLYRDTDFGRCDMGIFGGPFAIDPARPRRVEGLVIIPDSLRLTWTPVVYPTRIVYAIYRDTHHNFLPVELNGFSHRIDTTSIPTYRDTSTLAPGEIYCYRVNAFIKDTLVAGGYSNEICTDFLGVKDENMSPSVDIKAFPNPFNTTLNIDYPQGAKFEIFDITGQKIYALKENEKNWSPTQNIPNGIYFMRVYKGNLKRIIKVVYIK